MSSVQRKGRGRRGCGQHAGQKTRSVLGILREVLVPWKIERRELAAGFRTERSDQGKKMNLAREVSYFLKIELQRVSVGAKWSFRKPSWKVLVWGQACLGAEVGRAIQEIYILFILVNRIVPHLQLTYTRGTNRSHLGAYTLGQQVWRHHRGLPIKYQSWSTQLSFRSLCPWCAGDHLEAILIFFWIYFLFPKWKVSSPSGFELILIWWRYFFYSI